MKLVTKKQKPKTRTAGIKQVGTVVTPSLFDNKVSYVGRRIATSALRKKVVGENIPARMEKGFLLVHGDKPGILIHEVKWDGKDLYCRDYGKGHRRYGKLSALNKTSLKAEVISEKELRKRLLAFGKVVRVVNECDGTEHRLALLNSYGQPYVAAVSVSGSSLVPVNLEPKANYNPNHNFRFVNIKDDSASVQSFLRGK